MEDFRSYLGLVQYHTAIVIIHSDVVYELWFSDNYWTQSWKCDSAKYGDCMAGTWDVYVRSGNRFSSLDLSVPGRMIRSLRRVFGELGLNCAKPPMGVNCIRPIENSIGKVIAAKRTNGEERLSPDTQIPPYSRRTEIADENEWPAMGQALRQPKTRERNCSLWVHIMCG